jgi:hypothetical protein
MTSKVMLVFEVFSDLEWYGMEELQQLAELNEIQVREIVLSYRSITSLKWMLKAKKVRINRCFQEFLTQSLTHEKTRDANA